ncbi:hypothetical protein OKW31_002736 [Paraburkholderia atlantica]|uniref:hypothetical protein n=1 Tax=Paraburkholderia atlantica TaxID=2654982 RepID=UPI003D25C780
MSDMRLFRLTGGMATELPSQAAKQEKQLQGLVEANMQTFLGTRLLASEYVIGKTYDGENRLAGLR